MKLKRIMYLHETFYLAKNRNVTDKVKEGVVKNLLKTNHKMSFFC